MSGFAVLVYKAHPRLLIFPAVKKSAPYTRDYTVHTLYESIDLLVFHDSNIHTSMRSVSSKIYSLQTKTHLLSFTLRLWQRCPAHKIPFLAGITVPVCRAEKKIHLLLLIILLFMFLGTQSHWPFTGTVGHVHVWCQNLHRHCTRMYY